MPKTTLISITQVEGSKPIPMIEAYEDGAFVSRSSRELSADALISLICELYDVAPVEMPKQVLACEHCHKEYESMPRMGICTLCMGNVK